MALPQQLQGHQRLAQQNADEARKQQIEQTHQATDAAIGAKTRTAAAEVAEQTAASEPESALKAYRRGVSANPLIPI
jgi:hypothetical protein